MSTGGPRPASSALILPPTPQLVTEAPKIFTRTAVLITNLLAGASLPPIFDAGDWFYVSYNDQQVLQVQCDTGSPIQINNRQVVKTPFKNTLTISAVPTLGTVNTGELIYGRGEPPTVPPLSDDTNFDNPLVDAVVAANSQTLVLGPSGKNFAVDLCIPPGSAGGLRIGGSAAVSATQGMFLPIGIPWRVPLGRAGIYAFNPNASAVSVSLTSIVVA